MLDITEQLLKKMLIKEHFEGDKKKYIISKEQLIQFVIKYNNLLKENVGDNNDRRYKKRSNRNN